MAAVAFKKMHGLGNDFVVFDARDSAVTLTADKARAIADRNRGIGCDLIAIIRPSEQANIEMEMWNCDGTRSEACGNATRCIADLVLPVGSSDTLTIETLGGVLRAHRADGGICVDMGQVPTGAADVPLSARYQDSLSVDLGIEGLPPAVACSMGNPHATFFVDDVDSLDSATLGAVVEHHPAFPEKVNAGFAEMLPSGGIRLRMWERAAGITQACGTGACAAVVAAVRSGRLDNRKAIVCLDGGELTIEWREDGHILMTGPAVTSFVGEIDL